MRKWALILALLPSVTLANGPKYTYKSVPGLDDEMQNVYHDLKYPQTNALTVSSMTLNGAVGGAVLVTKNTNIIENPNGKLGNGSIFVADPNGFPTATSDGALNGSLTFSNTGTQGINGTTTNDNAAAGKVGEYVSCHLTNSNDAAGSAVYFDLCSISLTAGDWDIRGGIEFVRNGVTFSAVGLEAAFSTTSGNGCVGCSEGLNFLYFYPNALTTFTYIPIGLPTYRIALAGAATMYLKGLQSTYAAGNPQWNGNISARRVR